MIKTYFKILTANALVLIVMMIATKATAVTLTEELKAALRAKMPIKIVEKQPEPQPPPPPSPPVLLIPTPVEIQ